MKLGAAEPPVALMCASRTLRNLRGFVHFAQGVTNGRIQAQPGGIPECGTYG